MHDIRLIRDDPVAFDAALARRRLRAQADSLLEIDTRVREAQTQSDELRAQQREIGRQIAEYRKQLQKRRAEVDTTNDQHLRQRLLNEIRSEEFPARPI